MSWRTRSSGKDKSATSSKSSPPKVTPPKVSKIEQLFNKYKDAKEDIIQVDGFMKLLDDIKVEPDDVITLVIVWQFNARQRFKFSKDEFIAGCTKLGIEDVSSFQKKINDLRGMIKDENNFKEMYKFAFTYYLDGQRVKVLKTEDIIGLLPILLGKYPALNDFIKFLQEAKVQTLNSDTWDLLPDFFKEMNKDYSNFSDDNAWPVLLDDYVNWYRRTKKIKQ
ncbi:MAG: putative defective in cullin neddylation 1 protein [Streblomastix strix]|uniref:Defective in cullin neddylation protein n=1 Tax=Streblomastix strix TaxID=222440 RepID=A0A5J4W6I7_9EUKA|nr:MAG: putative defective in cullin neddylation 1 protein [Streblomastix strix]